MYRKIDLKPIVCVLLVATLFSCQTGKNKTVVLYNADSLITTQVPIDRWHDVIGDPTYADAVLDRIVHNAHKIALSGDSLRRQLNNATAS